jgi:hypothetical protein
MSALGRDKSLAVGRPIKLNDSPITGTGTLDFVILQSARAGNFSAAFQAVGTVTTLTASLQVASDQSTFVDQIASGSFISNTVQVKITGPLVAGVRYRVNITAATGTFDIWAVPN